MVSLSLCSPLANIYRRRRLVLLLSLVGGRLHPLGGLPLTPLVGHLLFVVGAVPPTALLLLVARLLVLLLFLPLLARLALPLRLSFALRGGPSLLVRRSLPGVRFAVVLSLFCR